MRKGLEDKEAPDETDVGKKAVLKLVTPFLNTLRNIVFDNFFTAVSLAIELWAMETTCIGTIRSNKAEVPLCFLKSKDRPELSSVFAFKDFLTAVSYVPKKNKVYKSKYSITNQKHIKNIRIGFFDHRKWNKYHTNNIFCHRNNC